MKKHWGFSLTELMIVVAIVGILATIALPAYNTFVIRAQVTEGLNLASAAQEAVVETYSTTAAASITEYGGSGPAAAGSYGYSFTPSSIVDLITISAIADTSAPTLTDARILIVYNSPISIAMGAPVVLQPGSGTIDAAGLPSAPLDPEAPIVWGCNVLALAQAFPYVPANCRF